MTTTYIRVGMGALSTLANFSYAGMRAQNDPRNEAYRSLAFVCGLPYSIVTLATVAEGSNMAYGVHFTPCPKYYVPQNSPAYNLLPKRVTTAMNSRIL